MRSERGVSRLGRRGLFGGIILAIFAVLIIGAIIFWAVAVATGHPALALAGFLFPFGFLLFPFGFLLFLLLVFFVFRLAFWRGRWGWHRYGYYGDSAHGILRERYARGEITKEQFEQMMRDLDQHPLRPA